MTTDADSIPNDFMCPLTLTLFEDPLVSKHGHSFERRAILEWLGEGNTTCPITRKPLTPSMLFPNAALRMRVKSWEKENCYSDGDDSDDDEASGQFVCRGGADAVAADRLLISFNNATDATTVVDDHVHPAVVLPLVQAKAEETVPVLLRAATPEDVVSFSQDKSFVDGKEWNLGGKWILVLQRKNEKKY
eukprot:CAMPEP_0113509504 /NCGR_PEP_ID=MMETSP0014_2-20120614/37616_1 /TAXON_ID=2857 /ORGANISM="Nitzschia sp." /LENGTH=189 /DNA_ID=CAMNT_0000405349 /DNA_START=142 /DNA_END=712 /DNA_ORIENTATION=- /assembly_acc=CAM_ASM_000159